MVLVSSSSHFNISSGETHLKRRRVLGERKVHRSWVGKFRIGNERVDVLRRARAVCRRRGLGGAAAVLPLLKGELAVSTCLQNAELFPPELGMGVKLKVVLSHLTTMLTLPEWSQPPQVA